MQANSNLVDPFSQYNPHGDFEGYPYDEKEMVKLCPKEFKQDDNPWTSYARKLIRTRDPRGWTWKIMKGRSEKLILLEKWMCVLLPNEIDLAAVTGWMLSEMLSEVPDY